MNDFSSYDDKDDEEFLNVGFLSLYDDDYLQAIEEKINGKAKLSSYDDEMQKVEEEAKFEDSFNSYHDTLKSLSTIFTSKFSRIVKVEDFPCFVSWGLRKECLSLSL
jgi:hypothetical protein